MKCAVEALADAECLSYGVIYGDFSSQSTPLSMLQKCI
jgi:hypothetical protein